jgi:hypothetical protein
MSKFNGILDDLNINEKFTKHINRPKIFNKVKDHVPLVPDWNMMCGLLFLPTAKFGFKYFFCIVNLATDDYVKEPKYSLKTVSGNEFKGVFP